MGLFSNFTHWLGERTGLGDVVNQVTKPVENWIHNAIPKEIRPAVQEPFEFLMGGKDLGELNIVPREVKQAIPKELHGISGPELAAILAGAYYGGPALLSAAGGGGSAAGSGSLLSLFAPGESMWWGTSGLPASLGGSIGVTPGALTSGTGGLAVNIPGVAGAAKGAGSFLPSLSAAIPSALGGTGTGLSSWILPTLGIGLGADFLSGYNQAKMEKGTKEALQNATNRYVAETTWNPEKRAEYMKGVQSELQSMLGGRRQRSGANVASRGISGGEYGEQMDKAYSEAMGEAVKKLYSTYEPSNINPAVLQAWATAASPTQSGGWRFLNSLANLAGTAGSQMLNWAMLQQLLGRA